MVKAVQMLTDHAKQCLSEANSFVVRAQQTLVDQVLDHPENATQVHAIHPIIIKSDELEKHLVLMERGLHLASEALDVPHMAMGIKDTEFSSR